MLSGDILPYLVPGAVSIIVGRAVQGILQPHPPDKLRPLDPLTLLIRGGLFQRYQGARTAPLPFPLPMVRQSLGGIRIFTVVYNLPLSNIRNVLIWRTVCKCGWNRAPYQKLELRLVIHAPV